MRELLKWIDRVAAIITVATFAFSLLHFFGAVPVPHFDLSSGRKAFVALVVYQVVMAIAVSGASALIYRGTRIVFLSMLFPVIAWSFVNVDVMKTLFGETVWAPASHGWWVFRLQQAQNTTGFWLSLLGAVIFLVLYTLLFVRRAAYDKFHQGDDASRQLAQMNAMVVVMGAVITAFVAHVAWIWLGAATVT
jgi:hypothetical protein